MRVGVLSDTHGNLPLEAAAAFQGCGHIIHAGDVGGPSLLLELEEIAPVTAVLGNNDFSLVNVLKRHEQIELGGVRFLIAHRLEEIDYLLSTWQTGRVLPHVCIFGHTHVPDDFRRNPGGIRMINPGALYGPRRGSKKSALLLEVSNSSIAQATFISP